MTHPDAALNVHPSPEIVASIGIKMDRMNAQVEVIVIDKVEKPSGN